MKTARPTARLNPALSVLARRDPRLGALIRRYGPLDQRPTRNPFHFLASCVINQQLSVAAGATIQGRVLARLKSARMTPAALRRAAPAGLRACGLSGSKARFLKELARAFGPGGSLRGVAWSRLEDSAVSERLLAVKGVGPWTVEMFLLFGLCRPDLYSPGDVALRRGMVRLYQLKQGPGLEGRLERIAARWRPHRSLASRYIWHAVNQGHL